MLSKLQAKAGIYISKQAVEELANELTTAFPKALREVLKDDFATGGKVFAGMALSMFGEIRRAISDQQTTILQCATPQERPQIEATLQTLLQRFDQLAALQIGTEETKRELQNLSGQIQSGFDQVLNRLGLIDRKFTDLLAEVKGEIINRIDIAEERLGERINQVGDKVDRLSADQEAQPKPVSIVIDQTRPKASYWQGRNGEIIEIQRWLRDPRINLIGIRGLGGYGKSALADKIYEAVDFPQKIWVNVNQPYNFSELGRWLLGQLGYQLDEKAGDDLLATELVNRLAAGKCLLVLDNLETLLQTDGQWQYPAYEQFFLKWIEYGRNSVILITSREQPRLPPNNSHWHPLTGLLIPDGEQLLRKREVQGSEAEIREFIELADGHPLLLNLAAGLLEDKAGKNPHISALKEPSLNLFEIVGLHRGDPEASVGELFAVSLERLDPTLQRLLLDLSVYRLPFNHKAAVAQLPPESPGEITEQNLRQLARSSLLQELEQRDEAGKRLFQFQPLLLSFARIKAGNLTEAHARAISYYLTIAKDLPWTTDDDLTAYFETFHHCCELKQYDRAYKILDTCYEFLNLHGYNLRLVSLYERLVQEWQPTKQIGQIKRKMVRSQMRSLSRRHIRFISTYSLSQQDQSKLGWARTRLGNAYLSLGQYKKANAFYRRSREILRAIEDRLGEAGSLGGLGNAYYSLGRYPQAIEYYQQSLEISREIGARREEANSIGNLGNAYHSLGQYQQAIEYHQQSLEIKQQIGDRQGKANSLNNLGNAYDFLGRYPQAIEYYQQSLEISREIGARREEANSIGNLGNAYHSLGQYQQAIEYHQQSLEISQEIGNCQGEADSLNNLGLAYYSLGQYQQAIEYHQQSLKISQEIGDHYGEANAWFNSGNALIELERKLAAITAFQNARELSQVMGLNANVQDCDDAIQQLVEADLVASNHSAEAQPQPTPKKNWLQTAVDWFWR